MCGVVLYEAEVTFCMACEYPWIMCRLVGLITIMENVLKQIVLQAMYFYCRNNSNR